MTQSSDWTIPTDLQPHAAQVDFDLTSALRSVVQLQAEIPAAAFTAGILGTERAGNGILIRHNGQQAVLTIGYLITEAESVWLTTYNDRTVAGHPLAYDQTTGLGLVLPLSELDAPTVEMGSADELTLGDEVIVAGHGDAEHSLNAKVVARHEFAGYWEYLLEDALFTSPPHPNWGGTALLNKQGQLVGVGSLLIQELIGKEMVDTNMFVPIDVLKSRIDEFMSVGANVRPKRPWLGVYAAEHSDGRVIVAGVIENSPAHAAGLRPEDRLIAVEHNTVTGLADFYRKLWACGAAGVDISLEIQRGKRNMKLVVHSANREALLLKPKIH